MRITREKQSKMKLKLSKNINYKLINKLTFINNKSPKDKINQEIINYKFNNLQED